jgi:hypothetical protein
MRVRLRGSICAIVCMLVSSGAGGCCGVGTISKDGVQAALSKVPPGSDAAVPLKLLKDEGFEPQISTGHIVANRIVDRCIFVEDGIAVIVYLDAEQRMVSSEVRSYRITP